MGAGPSQQPLPEQAQASDLNGSRPEQATSVGAGPNNLRDCRTNSRNTEQPLGMPTDLQGDWYRGLDSTTRSNHLSLESTGTWKSDHQRQGHNYITQRERGVDKEKLT